MRERKPWVQEKVTLPEGTEELFPIIKDIKGGMNTDLAPWLLDDAFKDLKNIRIRFGSLEPALVPATEVTITPDSSNTMKRLFIGSTPNNDNNLWAVQASNKLHRIDILAASPAATVVDASVGLNNVPPTATNTARWVLFGSTAAMQKTDGTKIYQVGITAPDAPTLTEPGGGWASGVLQGTYKYKTTFVGAAPAGVAGGIGSESPLSVESAEVEADDEQLIVAIDESADPQVTKRKIYRYGGTLTTWKLLTTIDNNDSSETYTDNTSDTDIVSGLEADLTQTAWEAGGQLVQSFKNRLFVAGFATYPTRVYFSALGSPDVTNDPTTSDTSGGWFEVGQGDGEAIKALSFAGSVLVIFKENSIYGLFGDHPSFFETRKLANIGTMHHDHVYPTPQGVLFRYQDNIWNFDGKEVTSITSGRIEKHLQSKASGLTIDANTVCGISCNEETQEYLFLLNTNDSAPTTTEMLTWDTNNNIFHRHVATEAVVHAARGMDRAYVLAASGKILGVAQETGTATTDWAIQPRDIYSTGAILRLVALEIGGFTDQTFTLKITTDQLGADSIITLTIPVFTGNFYTRLPDNCYGNKFTFELYDSPSAASMQISSLSARANVIRRQTAQDVA